MKNSYSFLKDELALIEIRKHKWLESEKQNREIGFATATMDWIKRYGEEWKKARLISTSESQNVFSEKRRYRRFYHNFPVTLKTDTDCIAGFTNDINLVGLSCIVPALISGRAGVEVTIALKGNSSLPQMLKFHSQIIRASTIDSGESLQPHYQIVLSLTEQIRDYLRVNANFFALVEDARR